MIHAKRRFTVIDIATAEELADKLTNYSWCGCNGFRFNGLLLLNDSFSGDGAQEYAIVRGPLRNVGADNIYEQIETPEQHGRCEHCA
jgi:hypothetical protein